MLRSKLLTDMFTDELHNERKACLKLTNAHYYNCSERVIEYHADYADRISDEIDSRNNAPAKTPAMVTLTKDAVTLYDIETHTVWRTMSVRDGEHEVQLCYGLGDVVQEYETTDLTGNPIRVVLQIDAPSEHAKPDQGGVYVFTR